MALCIWRYKTPSQYWWSFIQQIIWSWWTKCQQVCNHKFITPRSSNIPNDPYHTCRTYTSTSLTFANRVNSKATLKVSLSSILKLTPSVLHSAIRHSRYSNAASESLTIQSDDSRKQSSNIDNCFVKLHDMIVEAGAKSVPGETSESQKELVKN